MTPLEQPETYIVTVEHQESQEALLALLRDKVITGQWTVVNPFSPFDGEWQGAGDDCWPLLKQLLEDELQQVCEDEISRDDRRRIIRLAVERWNYTSNSGLDRPNVMEDYLAGKIPGYPPTASKQR